MTEINDQIQLFNKSVAGWSKRFENGLKSQIRALSQKGKGDLLRSLRGRTYKRDGEIDRIGYGFERHGVFWQKGVGKGYVMQNGFVQRGRKVRIGRSMHDKRTDFRAVAGQINRRPKDWFNGPLGKGVEELADIVVEHYADRTVNATRMQIK
ncbi:MAG: hypothetical protein EGP82_10635 [Odoribacter splanchnicus]|nr:hypothetical protein [Odoribacter splanchnicus]